jgi:hypothetical protein
MRNVFDQPFGMQQNKKTTNVRLVLLYGLRPEGDSSCTLASQPVQPSSRKTAARHLKSEVFQRYEETIQATGKNIAYLLFIISPIAEPLAHLTSQQYAMIMAMHSLASPCSPR